jgi:hypothetical protein
MVTLFFTGTKLLTFRAVPRENTSNQDNLLSIIAPESSKEKGNPGQRLRKNQLAMHIDKSMCYDDGMIR